ncbi:hypothetical protein [Bacillus sp. 03113]|nr:hypothetical protein [Bacillus sp. 03113]
MEHELKKLIKKCDLAIKQKPPNIAKSLPSHRTGFCFERLATFDECF